MIRLSEISTKAPDNMDKGKIKAETKDMAKRISKLSWKLYAEQKRNLLIVLQGMDATGKDGSTKKVFGYTSPAVVTTYSFKKPTDEEFDHDFLWRVHKQAPRKGTIKIFNRSHYEDVLIQRVHKWINEDQVDRRIASINAFEKLLVEDNHTTILKFYLHISEERQKEKLIERIEDESKNWKHNDGDWEQRKYWNRYMEVYEDVINRSEIPWHIIPVDSRSYRNYAIAKKILNTLESMNLEYPILKEKPDIDYNG